MSGHTPGPWFLDDDETGMIVYPATWKGCDNRTRRMALIAAVSPWDGRAQENREAVMAEARANAALIASAPTLSAQVATLTARCDKLEQEARIHAMEARTQLATVRECYQVVTGGKGEPSDWNGAEPVRIAFATLTAERDAMRKALEFYANPLRYEGPNQKPMQGEVYGPHDFEYVWDVSRDQGGIARAALEGGRP